jgi:hypothetical protein
LLGPLNDPDGMTTDGRMDGWKDRMADQRRSAVRREPSDSDWGGIPCHSGPGSGSPNERYGLISIGRSDGAGSIRIRTLTSIGQNMIRFIECDDESLKSLGPR